MLPAVPPYFLVGGGAFAQRDLSPSANGICGAFASSHRGPLPIGAEVSQDADDPFFLENLLKEK